jgi:hypothetical protein
MRRLIFIGLIVLLVGCQSAERPHNTVSSEQQSKEEKPPALQLTIANQVMKTYRGTYEWNYYDEVSGQMISIHADHAAPTQMVDIHQGRKVNLTESVHLKFAKDPQRYEVRLWDAENVIATYKSFDEVTQKGNYIVEIVGYWEQGRGTYVLALSLE